MGLYARRPERSSVLTWAPYGSERCCGALHRVSEGPEVLPSNNFVYDFKAVNDQSSIRLVFVVIEDLIIIHIEHHYNGLLLVLIVTVFF